MCGGGVEGWGGGGRTCVESAKLVAKNEDDIAMWARERKASEMFIVGNLSPDLDLRICVDWGCGCVGWEGMGGEGRKGREGRGGERMDWIGMDWMDGWRVWA